jgi:Domain of unknown function (DUF2383)
MNENKVNSLNELLRGVLSAVETYNQVISSVDDSKLNLSLSQMRDEHQRVADTLETQIKSEAGIPSTGSGPWGIFAKAVTGGAKLIGTKASLEALTQGEKHGLSEYEEFIQKGGIDLSTREMVESNLIPLQNKHIRELEQLQLES